MSQASQSTDTPHEVTMSMDMSSNPSETIPAEGAPKEQPIDPNALPSDSLPPQNGEKGESTPPVEGEGELQEKLDTKLSDKVPDNPHEIREEANRFLGEKGINLDALEDAYAEKGELTAEHYAELEKAGFPRKLVDTYIAGMEASIAKAGIAEEQLIKDVQDSVGGQQEFLALQQWVKDNLGEDAINAWNEATATNNVSLIKTVIGSYHKQYTNAVGQSPQYVQGNTGQGASTNAYNSWAEVQRDMSDPRYHTDEAFNQKVVAKLGRSSLT